MCTCRYEGTTRSQAFHGKGVLTLGLVGGGGGFYGAPGDRYEGEFMTSFAHGVGVYFHSDGRIYKGQMNLGVRHGCGVEYDLRPWKERVKNGQDPQEALRDAMPEIEARTRMGSWKYNQFHKQARPVSELSGNGGKMGMGGTGETDIVCNVDDVRLAVKQATSLAARARMFAYKPGGDVRSNHISNFVCRCLALLLLQCMSCHVYCLSTCCMADMVVRLIAMLLHCAR